nr:carboxypeptidase regulatory-like domain-containing protein [uncultured Holophaga sp.]
MNRIVLALVGATICISAQADTTGRISGQVRDAAGKPIAGADITLTRTDITWTKSVKSNQHGSYIQVGLDPKVFQVAVSAEGYVPQQVQVKIPLGDNLVQNFVLLTPDQARATGVQVSEEAKPNKAAIGADAFNAAVAAIQRQAYAEALPKMEVAYQNLKEAREELPEDKRAQADQSFAQAERVYGVVLFETGRTDASRQAELWSRAETPLKAALARDGKDQVTLNALATILKAKGDEAEAARYQAALDALVGPRPEKAYDQGVEAYNNGNMAKAKTFFKKALEVDPKFADAYYLLAMCDYAENNLRSTKQNFQKYLQYAPSGKHAGEVRAMLDDPSLKSIR